MKKIFILHGWDGHPGENWFPWLKKELEMRGFFVSIPHLPDAGNPRIERWVTKLSSVAPSPDADTYFVGHSMGCQTIVRYLESLPMDVMVGGAVFVAGFFKSLTNIDDKETEKHWLETPLDLKRAKSHLLKSIAIFSDDDPYVPLDNQDVFREELGSKIIIEHAQKHFSEGSGGFKELPIVLDSVLKIAR